MTMQLGEGHPRGSVSEREHDTLPESGRALQWRILKKMWNVGATLVLLLAGVGIVAVLVGMACGLRPAAVLSGSMRPTMQVGDLIVSHSVAPLSVHPGDLVTFHSPQLHNQTITHRVVSRERSGDVVNFVTKGDANSTTERWHVPVDGKVGLGVFHVRYVGRWLITLTGSAGRTVLIAITALMVMGSVIHWMFQGREDE